MKTPRSLECCNQSLVTAAVVLSDGILPWAQGQEASLGRQVGQCMGQPVLCSAGAMPIQLSMPGL